MKFIKTLLVKLREKHTLRHHKTSTCGKRQYNCWRLDPFKSFFIQTNNGVLCFAFVRVYFIYRRMRWKPTKFILASLRTKQRNRVISFLSVFIQQPQKLLIAFLLHCITQNVFYLPYLLNSSSFVAPVTSVSSSFGTFGTAKSKSRICLLIKQISIICCSVLLLLLSLHGAATAAVVVIVVQCCCCCCCCCCCSSALFTYLLLQPGEILTQGNCISYLQREKMVQ